MSSCSAIPSIATYSSPFPRDLVLSLLRRSFMRPGKLIGCTESCLYVCIRSAPPELNPRWLTLSLRPTGAPNPRWFNLWWTPTTTLKHTLVSVPSRNYSPKFCWGLTAVGSNIYMIGDDNNSLREPSSRVFTMDCQSHTWREAPSMLVARKCPWVKVHDGKIYVIGGTQSSMWIECFDPKTQKWKDVTSPDADIRVRSIRNIFSMEGNLYLVGEKKLVYKPEEDEWDVALGSELLWDRGSFSSICMINNVLIAPGSSSILKWYDFEERSWRVLKGLEKLDKLVKYYSRVKFLDYGGKIAVLLDVHSAFGVEQIWCAEITLERRAREEMINGRIEWCDLVLEVPKSTFIDNFVAVTV